MTLESISRRSQLSAACRLFLPHFPLCASAPLRFIFLLLLLSPRADAYPEFQVFIKESTGRAVNCAMCHAHSDGPEGTAAGQIGRLDAADMDRLAQARAALQPGQKVDSPILNPFGNHLIEVLGKEKFVELRTAPEALAELLPADSDLDHDGIPDAREYKEGTHPVNRMDGNPAALLLHNFKTSATSIGLTLAATVLGMWGLGHLLRGFARAASAKEEVED